MARYDAELIGRSNVVGDYLLFRFSAPELVAEAKPGQFVHIRVPGLEPSALRRPFSIYDARDGVLSILFKKVGRGTEVLAQVREGTRCDIIGPLGHGFPLPSDEVEPVLVGGGYGVAPLVFLAREIGRPGVAMIGGRSAVDILCAHDFEELGWEVRLATVDGSLGTKGFVTIPLDERLADKSRPTPELFACGPDGMLKAVGDRAIANGCKGWLSLDKHMVCGVGACLACIQRLRDADGVEWIGRCCKDGPVFESREIVWEVRS